MSEYLGVTDTAKLVRAALKKAFPGTRFSVRSSSYSGGASIDVAWTDGPRAVQVDKVTAQFTGSGFDGAVDLKTYNQDWLYPDGHAEPYQVNIGHSHGGTTRDGSGGEVSREDTVAYQAAVTYVTTDPGKRDTDAWLRAVLADKDTENHPYVRGLEDAERRVAAGARLVHFGADHIFTRRDLSAAYTATLEQAVLTLAGDPGPFDGNKMYTACGPWRGRPEDYGYTHVRVLSEADPAELKAELATRQPRTGQAAVTGPAAA